MPINKGFGATFLIYKCQTRDYTRCRKNARKRAGFYKSAFFQWFSFRVAQKQQGRDSYESHPKSFRYKSCFPLLFLTGSMHRFRLPCSRLVLLHSQQEIPSGHLLLRGSNTTYRQSGAIRLPWNPGYHLHGHS